MCPLPEPTGRQAEVLYLDSVGHTVVLGAAGSGKSTMAVLRAAHLGSDYVLNGGPTLLVTFNKALASHLRGFLEGDGSDVTVQHYQQFATEFLASRGRDIVGRGCLGSERRRLIEQAVHAVRETWVTEDPVFDRPVEFLEAEITWIAENGMASEDEYVEIERTGRAGARMPRASRPAMWEIRADYFKRRDAAGREHDFADLATQVREALEDSSESPFRHVVIDEGQDFSREMLRSLATAIPSEGSLTFLGDYAQELYGRRRSWRSAGLNVRGKIWEFQENYRNTRQVALLAEAMTRAPWFGDAEELVDANLVHRDGALPRLVRCRDEHAELVRAATMAASAVEMGSVAVLFRHRRGVDRFSDVFDGTVHRLQDERPSRGVVSCGTIHAAKGLEFDHVLLPWISRDHLPSPALLRAFGEEEALQMDARVLYVGVTRARHSLTMLYSGQPTPLLPLDENLLTTEEMP